MLAVEASTAPGVLETEMPGYLANKTLHHLLQWEKPSRLTFGGAGSGIDLVISCAIMRNKPKAWRKPIDQFLVKSPGQL